MGVYVLKQHTPAQLAALQRRVVDTIIAGKPPHGFNMRAFHSQPPKGSELDWFVGRHLDYHMRAADRGDLLTGGPMQRLRRVRLRAEGEVAAAGVRASTSLRERARRQGPMGRSTNVCQPSTRQTHGLRRTRTSSTGAMPAR